MSEMEVPAAAIDRLRSNLRAAGIQISEADIVGMSEKGFLQRVVALDAALAHAPVDAIPDYLAAWADRTIWARFSPPRVPCPATLMLRRRSSPRQQRALTRTLLSPWPPDSAAREVSPVELTEQALAAIAQHDPALNAFQLVLETGRGRWPGRPSKRSRRARSRAAAWGAGGGQRPAGDGGHADYRRLEIGRLGASFDATAVERLLVAGGLWARRACRSTPIRPARTTPLWPDAQSLEPGA